MSSCKLYHDFILAPIKCQKKKQQQQQQQQKTRGEGGKIRFPPFSHSHCVLRAHSISLSPSLLLQGLGTTQARVNRLYLAWFLNIASYNNTPLTEIKY